MFNPRIHSEIERYANRVRIIINTARPAVVMGVKGGDVVVTSGEVSLFGMSAPQAPDNTTENV